MTTANAVHWDSHDIRPRSRKMCIATTCPMYWAVALPRTNQLQGGAPEGASAAPPQSCGCSCERDCNATAVPMQTHVNASVLLLTHQESLQIWARARRLQLALRSTTRKMRLSLPLHGGVKRTPKLQSALSICLASTIPTVTQTAVQGCCPTG